MSAPVAVAVSAPRAHAITQRFPGNVRLGLFEDLLGAIWAHLQDCLLEPLRVEETENERRATFMAAVRFTVDKCSGQVTVSQLTRQRDIEMEKVERQLGGKVRQEQDRQKWLAVLLPPIPPLVVAFFVYFRRRAQEREGVAKTRLR